jgi:hypothetical protein
MPLAVKIIGGPTLWDATIGDGTYTGQIFVSGVEFSDDHPMLMSANTAITKDAYGVIVNDSTTWTPVGYVDGTSDIPVASTDGKRVTMEVAASRIHETTYY